MSTKIKEIGTLKISGQSHDVNGLTEVELMFGSVHVVLPVWILADLVSDQVKTKEYLRKISESTGSLITLK